MQKEEPLTILEHCWHRKASSLIGPRGSHHIFKRSGVTFVVPVHGNRVKSVYVKRLIELIVEAKGKSK